MIEILIIFVLQFITTSTIIYRNDYEPRIFDYIPSNCYDCLSYRDIILTQLTTIPARSFANFYFGTHDTNLILSGQLKLNFQPYAFQSLIVQKPNQTLTITFTAPNSWLNITEKTFYGLEIRPYSTLRIIIKFFYGCTFHSNAFSGIEMGLSSRLILDLSSVTQIHFENNIFNEYTQISSINFIISRTDTIIFHPFTFSYIKINSNENLSFHFELISHIHLKSSSFHSLNLSSISSFHFYALFLNRLTFDTYAFNNIAFENQSIFNITLHTLGTCLCFKSFTFNNFYQIINNYQNIRMIFHLNTFRGLSFLSQTFYNISLNYLQIYLENSINNPNPIINFARHTFISTKFNEIILNISSTSVIRFEENSLKTNSLSYQIYLQDITFLDLSLINSKFIETNLYFYLNYIRFIKWFNHTQINSYIHFYFQYLSNNSCIIYHVPHTLSLLFSNTTICNCPILYAYKYGQLDGQIISCIRTMSGYESAQKMDQCQFNEKLKICNETIQSFNNQSQYYQTIEIDHFLLRQLYDENYLTCSYNYTILTSSNSLIIRSRLFNSFGLVIGIILAIFIILLILVMALLNGLQYKMREYDETWTWRRNMSWTSLRRTISQTSLRRSRKDLRTINGNVITSKSDNQLDRLRYDHDESEEDEEQNVLSQQQTIIEDTLKKT